jgi:hypothetical protein
VSAGRQDARGETRKTRRCGIDPAGNDPAGMRARRWREWARKSGRRLGESPPGRPRRAQDRSQTPDLGRTGRLRDHRLPGRLPGKGG